MSETKWISDNLTHNKLEEGAKITYSDGLAGAVLPKIQVFITSPNMTSIPEPPYGSTRDIYRRSDARYGPDDPCRWPQPFNPLYPYLACMPVQPEDELWPFWEYRVMWSDIQDKYLEYTPEGQTQEAIVGGTDREARTFVERLKSAVKEMEDRAQRFFQISNDARDRALVGELRLTMEVCLIHITTITSPIHELQRGLVELQRAWMTLQAIFDYLDQFAALMRGEGRAAKIVNRTRLGAFVWDDWHASLLFRAGLPVYFVRPYSSFRLQVILKRVPLIQPVPPKICVAQAKPPYLPIATTQAGSETKFAAIRIASVNCFLDKSPFENSHHPGAYQSSHRLGVDPIISPVYSSSSAANLVETAAGIVRSDHVNHAVAVKPYDKSKRAKPRFGKGVGPPPEERNPFDDYDSTDPMAPATIPAWERINMTIETRGVAPQKKFFIVPDPGLFFGARDEGRQDKLFHQWEHFRPAWLARCRDSETPIEPQNTEAWRKILYMPTLLETQKSSNRANESKKQALKRDAFELAQDTMDRFGGKASPVTSCHGPFDSKRGQVLIWELAMINFRHEMLSVDGQLDVSRPRPSVQESVAQLGVAEAQHRRSREDLVDKIFQSGSTFQPSSDANRGLVSEDWPERYKALKVFWQLMDTWSSEKPVIWRRGIDADLNMLPSRGQEWEYSLSRFYVQSAFLVFKRPPVLPRRLRL